LIVALHAIGFLFQPSFHPPYAPEIANTIQRWEISTLRDQIHAGRVKRVAIYQDCSSVEVLDVNGLQRKIDIFPEVAPLLVKDMHAEHIDFFVAPAPEPSPLVPFARAFVFTLLVVWIIDALGMLPTFLFGAAIIGWLVLHAAHELDLMLTEAWEGMHASLVTSVEKHDAACAATLAYVGLRARRRARRFEKDEEHEEGSEAGAAPALLNRIRGLDSASAEAIPALVEAKDEGGPDGQSSFGI